MNNTNKFCIFCGKHPESKTKEHVIPQWLIKMTGDPNRKVNFGVDTKALRTTHKLRMLKFGFSSFQFPACNSCNNEFAQLESDTKSIVEKILNKEFVSNFEISTLLDWFDKVRIGLWLGYLLMDREIAPITPNFHIKKRMGEKDRCLFVYEIADDWKGVQFVGSNFPSFQFTPSCFSLCINNFHFYNLSFEFLFSKNIGFPYPHKKRFRENEIGILFELSKGKEKVKMPLISRNFANPSIKIFQPIIQTKLVKEQDFHENFYDNTYVKSNCMDYTKGYGDIFYEENGCLIKLDNEDEICLSDSSSTYDRELFMSLISKQVYETQLNLTMQMPSTEDLSEQATKRIKDAQKSVIKMQKKLLDLI